MDSRKTSDQQPTSPPSTTGPPKKSIEDYEFIRQVGEGAFGNVYLAREKALQSLVAVKVLDKAHIVKFDKTKAVYREKDILNKFVSNPNVIKLDTVFQVTDLWEYSDSDIGQVESILRV